MGDARVPPAGPPPRDPTAPARLLDAAAEVGLRVERAQRQLDGLERAVDKLAEATGTPPRAPVAREAESGASEQEPGDDDAEGESGERGRLAQARAYAIDLAVGGAGRDVIRAGLRGRFGITEPDALLDDVMGKPTDTPGDGESPRPPLAGAGPDDDGVPAGQSGVADADADSVSGGAAAGSAQAVEARAGKDFVPSERSRRMLPAAIQSYGSQVGAAALGLVNVIVMARALGASGRGEVAFLTAIAFLASNLWTFGVQEANVNLAGAEPAKRPALATNSLILSALLGAAGALLVAAFIWIVPAAGAGVGWGLIWLILASIPMLVLNTYLRFLIQGDYGFTITNFVWFLPSVINVAVTVLFAALGELTVWIAVLTWVLGQTLATAIMIWWVQARAAGFGRPDRALARRSLVFGVKSHIGRIMLIANYRLDQWILGAVAGTKQLGQYSVAVAWAEALFLLPTALSAVQRPAIVRAGPREAVKITARVFRISLLITAACALGLVIMAPFLCVTIFGEEFSDSVADLRVLAGGAFGVVALKQLGNALTGRDRPLAASLSIGSAFLFTVALDIVLIPRYEDLGAAIASTVAYTLGGFVIITVFNRSLGGRVLDLVPRPADVHDIRAMLTRVLGRGRRTPGAVEPLPPAG
jgi:O-antigen/teichoic acid export membrane protein